ncbi:bZIP transcription factor [Brevibacillus sp. NRS-1366]|uniref:bZIP transcription factor n=1 Tax=Brevibacillus sp. NRS-1366 TaxID=3233899 RepID=UPI003D207BD5
MSEKDSNSMEQFKGNAFISFIGWSYIMLGIGILFFDYHVDPIYLTCLSLTALFVSLSETNPSKRWEGKKLFGKSLPDEETVSLSMFILAAMCMVFLPFNPAFVNLSQETLGKFGNTATLVSLGISISLIGKRSNNAFRDYVKKISNTFVSITEKGTEEMKQLINRQAELIDEMEKRLNALSEENEKLMKRLNDSEQVKETAATEE